MRYATPGSSSTLAGLRSVSTPSSRNACATPRWVWPKKTLRPTRGGKGGEPFEVCGDALGRRDVKPIVRLWHERAVHHHRGRVERPGDIEPAQIRRVLGGEPVRGPAHGAARDEAELGHADRAERRAVVVAGDRVSAAIANELSALVRARVIADDIAETRDAIDARGRELREHRLDRLDVRVQIRNQPVLHDRAPVSRLRNARPEI